MWDYNMNVENNISNAKILIAEDEPQINRLIELVLESGGYHKIQKAYDGKEALELIKLDKPDLILMDIMMPEIDGFELCKKIKSTPSLSSIQIIMLTACKMEEDVIKSFESGAIDYISKPFSNKILLARIKARLLNSNITKQKTYKNITLDNIKKEVALNGNVIKLTKFEYIILETFMANVGVVFSRSQLLSYLRGDDGFNVSERAMDVQIVNLRKKLGELGANIETVRGLGYKLKEEA